MGTHDESGDSGFSISFQRPILTGRSPFYRSFDAVRYRFSVKKMLARAGLSRLSNGWPQKPSSSSATRISRFPA
jgi:hypothetical protein